MGEEYTKLKGLRKQAQFLHEELSSMVALLEDLEDKEGLDNQTKQWRNKVREMSYDIEDCLDDFMHRVGGPNESKGLMRRLKTLRARHQLANQIQELKAHVQEASAGHMSLVGIDGPKEEVIKMLMKVDDASMQELRVVSIVGFGGLGKTTLANEVYRSLGKDFDFKAFISVSQRPDVIGLLKILLSKVAKQDISRSCELPEIIDNIKKHLQGKRYLIVVDDLWDTSPWKIIKCAFPEDHCGSRVLTTTRINSVAVTCSCYQKQLVYTMKPLNYDNSRQLFFRRLFGTDNTCPRQLEELANKILHRCGGMPLAIITVASILACQSTTSIHQWKYVIDSLRHDLGSYPTLEGMRSILNLSYTHLPRHLKTCLLYVCMYPEDHEIDEEELIMQWIAEGFVSGVGGRDAVEIARSYLNELVNRSLIFRFVSDDDTSWEFIHYKVHDMVLDLLLLIATEYNFLCVSDNLQRIAGLQCKARRVSLQLNSVSLDNSAARVSLPHIRSLLMIGSSLPNLQALKLKFLRVLSLYVDVDVEGFDVTSVSNLYHLRYLKIHCTSSAQQVKLPRQMCGLQQLEVLSVRGTLSFVPTDIVDLPALSFLYFSDEIAYPNGISKLRSLRTLENFDPSKQSMDNLRGLADLEKLNTLSIWCVVFFHSKEPKADALLASIEKLIGFNLRNLEVLPDPPDEFAGYHSKWSSFCFSCSQLEYLRLLGLGLPRIPKWIGQLCMLKTLDISVEVLCEDDLVLLAGLPALVTLFLHARNVPVEGIVFRSDATFKVVARIKLPYVSEVGFTFQAGAMPKVEKLNFQLLVFGVMAHGLKLTGIEHLPSLKIVNICILFEGHKKPEERELDSAILLAAIANVFKMHPARPTIKISSNEGLLEGGPSSLRSQIDDVGANDFLMLSI